MSIENLSCVRRLVRAIRSNLPLLGHECLWTVQELPVFCDQLPPYRGGWGWSGQGGFSALLTPVPEERWHTPDGLLLRQENMQAVGEVLRDVCAIEGSTSTPEYQYFRAVLDELLRAPLYEWHWTGAIPLEPDLDNPNAPDRPAPWRPIRTALCYVDDKLLEDLVATAERCWLRPASSVPRWDDDGRTLYFDGKEIKKFRRHPAPNQTELLTAFEEEGWPPTIPDPFTDPQKLEQTIWDINKRLPPGTIRFRGDGTGEGVTWEKAPPHVGR
jgi:hypothetical protein